MAGECLFCGIATKTIPAELVYETDTVVAFKDLHPQAPTHYLIIPRKHVGNMMELAAADTSVVGDIHWAAQVLANLSKADNGFRLVVNNGPDAGQSVGHLHYHFLAGRKLNWPPG